MSIVRLLSASAAAILAASFAAQPAAAAMTQVTCDGPVMSVLTGKNGTAPRVTVFCSLGSSAGNIVYFAWRISDNPDVAQLVQSALAARNIRFAAAFNDPTPAHNSIPLTSDLADTSGNAWGCGAANCRIINEILGD